MTDTEFITLLLDVVDEARNRSQFGAQLLRERGSSIVHDTVRLCHDLCRHYKLVPADVDRRLTDRNFL